MDPFFVSWAHCGDESDESVCDSVYPFPMHLVSQGKFKVKFSFVICHSLSD